MSRALAIYRPGKKPIPIVKLRPVRAAFGLDVVGVRTVTVELPFPPGLNNLFFNLSRGGRAATARYREWRAEAEAMLAEQRPGRVTGKFIALIEVSRPDNRKRDIDGLIKATMDALKPRVIEDDSLCEDLRIVYRPGIEGARVTITKCEEEPSWPNHSQKCLSVLRSEHSGSSPRILPT